MGHCALFSLMTGLAFVRHLVYSDRKKYQSSVVTILINRKNLKDDSLSVSLFHLVYI